MKFDCMYLLVSDGSMAEDDLIWNSFSIKVANGYDNTVGS